MRACQEQTACCVTFYFGAEMAPVILRYILRAHSSCLDSDDSYFYGRVLGELLTPDNHGVYE